MQLYQIVGLCLAIATMAVALELRFRDCGSEGAKVESLDVTPCENDPCILHRGTTYTSKVVFTPLINSTTIFNTVTVYVFQHRFHIHLPPNACIYFKCPVIAGQQQTGQVKFPISRNLPRTGINLRWLAYGDNRKKLFCISLHYIINKNELSNNTIPDDKKLDGFKFRDVSDDKL